MAQLPATATAFVISVDAQSTAELENLRYGVDIARRGRVRRDDVLKALPPEEVARAVKPFGGS